MKDNNFCLVKENYDVSSLNTYGTGGKAKCVCFPNNEEELIASYKFAKNNFEKFAIIGNGSNVLFSDNYYDGVIICTKKFNKIFADGNNLICQSGVTVSNLLRFCIENNLTGLEYLAGIPASIGGLVYMNGGINSRHIGDDVKSIEIFSENVYTLSNEMCKFSNKHSTMRDIDCIVLTVCLNVRHCDGKAVNENINKFLLKRSLQPKGRSCGCVFKNPPDLSAGSLIDLAGLKNTSVGKAHVSDRHANFIINDGDSSDDVYRLIKIVQRLVFEKFGILLEEEVVYIGDFNETDR